MASTFIDEEETIASLSPVALMQSPICVLKKRIITKHTIAVNIKAIIHLTASFESKGRAFITNPKISVFPISDTLTALFITARLTVCRPLIVIIPESIGFILHFV
ncbi:hypothetical protein SDC9_137728 [bioreactor metagenome]|uniref:Uncharacterized protein n=1 Tax=bioreactor metagenome TaxID=1076179 RepID=A0A645DMS6_9ZZZZ